VEGPGRSIAPHNNDGSRRRSSRRCPYRSVIKQCNLRWQGMLGSTSRPATPKSNSTARSKTLTKPKAMATASRHPRREPFMHNADHVYSNTHPDVYFQVVSQPDISSPVKSANDCDPPPRPPPPRGGNVTPLFTRGSEIHRPTRGAAVGGVLTQTMEGIEAATNKTASVCCKRACFANRTYGCLVSEKWVTG